MSECADKNCDRQARMAVRTTRPTRVDLRVTVYADDRVAPKSAMRYCKEHGLDTVAGLLEIVVDGDDAEVSR